MKIQLSDHFTYHKLIRFTAPSIIMMIFTSVYSVVDGFFISNIVGKTAFASVNLIMPFLIILGGFGSMLGVGGSALVAKTLGAGEHNRANRYFTMMLYLMIFIGVLCSVLGIIFIRPVAYLFGASEGMIEDCVIYGRIILVFNTAWLMQYAFQSFLIVAERPKLGLYITLGAGAANILLDALFVAVFRWGIVGAALATGLSQTVGGVFPLLWFLSKKNTSSLHFTKTGFELMPIVRASANGISEMLSSVSASITGILYNWQLMKHAGENGVAAYGVVMYAAFVFIAVFIGFSSGSAPIISYHYGAANTSELKNMRRKSLTIIGAMGTTATVIAVLLARPISSIFVGYDEALLDMTARAFAICALPFIVMGFNIYSSSLFTALNNGVVSAIISFARSLLFPVITILVLPIFFALDGVWYSMLLGEVLSFAVAITLLVILRKKYDY